MPPSFERIDHIHVYVADRVAAERWYGDVLGLRRQAELAFWAADGGPLTLTNESGTVHLALFEEPAQACRSTIALSVSATDFLAWKKHLSSVLGWEIQPFDHDVSWSIYFVDPDGNPYEITSYEHQALAPSLAGS